MASKFASDLDAGVFTEGLHGNWVQSFEVKTPPLIDEQSAFQHIQIFDTEAVGRMLVLDGIVQLTEADEASYSEMLTHLPLFELKDPKRALIVGGGDGAVAEEILKHPVIEIDLVDIDGRVVELCKDLFPNVHNGAFDDPRFHLHIEDASAFLKRPDTRGRYDLIIADRPDPVGPAEILFAQDFYDNVSAALTDQGVAVFQTGVPFVQGDELVDAIKLLTSSFKQAGTYLTVTPTYFGGHMALTWASNGMTLGRTNDLEKGFRAANIKTDYYTPAVHKAAFALPRFIEELIAG
ncbi:speE [Symbiodinium microadriaticum]|nr:speE [Symbiodinium microadriaticum]